MPQKLLFDYNTEERFSVEALEHPTHGVMKWLMIYNDYTENTDNITAIYFDTDNNHHEITSNRLSNCINPQNLRLLLCAIETITDRKVFLEALLSLLAENSKSVSISTQTLINNAVVIKKRTPSFSLAHDSEVNGEMEIVESGTENQAMQNSNTTESPLRIVKIEHLVSPTPQINSKPVESSQNINKGANNQENADTSKNVTADEETTNYKAALDDDGNNKSCSSLILFDGSTLRFPVSPKDMFHLTAPNILEYLTREERQKLIVQQAFFDWKYCLKPNSEGYTPIHLAVLHDDVGLLKRQIAVLKAKDISIDVMARGMSPLHVAIKKNNVRCTKILLDKGANPLLFSTNHRNALHLAALATIEVFDAVLEALLFLIANKAVCRKQAQTRLARRKSLLEITDAFGYNALMLACKQGNLRHMLTLYKYCPKMRDNPMPSTGNTALHIVLSDFLAYTSYNKPGPKQKGQLQVICKLLTLGASPTIRNNYGVTFFDLLQKFRSLKLHIYLEHLLNCVKYDPVMFESFWAAFVQNGDEDKRNSESWMELYRKALLKEVGCMQNVVPWNEYRKSLDEELNLKEASEKPAACNEHLNELNDESRVPKAAKICVNTKVKKTDSALKNYLTYGGYFKTLSMKRERKPKRKTPKQTRIEDDFSKTKSIMDLDDTVIKNSSIVPSSNNPITQKEFAKISITSKDSINSSESTVNIKKRKLFNVDRTSPGEKLTKIFNHTNDFVKINAVLSKVNDFTLTGTSDNPSTDLQDCSVSQNDTIDNKQSNIDSLKDINKKVESKTDFTKFSKVSVRGKPIEMRKVFVVRKEN